MTKRKAKPATEGAPEGQGSGAPEQDRETSSRERDSPDSSPRVTLSSAVGGIDAGDDAGPAGLPARPGALPLPFPAPAIPADIDAELNARERRIVWRMVEGASYAQALRDTARTRDAGQRSQERTDAIPPAVRAAVSACIRQIAVNAGISRTWIIEQTMALYARASQAEPVLDRKGVPTGEYRFDGATASKCLGMLAEWCPELTPKRGGGFGAGEVAELMLAVHARGRGAIADSGRLVGSSSAAPQQLAKP